MLPKGERSKKTCKKVPFKKFEDGLCMKSGSMPLSDSPLQRCNNSDYRKVILSIE